MTTINEPPINPNSTSDYRESSFQQKLREHVFISELLQEIWIGERQTMEVLRSEVDNYGYDLLLALDGIVRYVQL